MDSHMYGFFVGQIASGTELPKLVKFPGLGTLVSFSRPCQSVFKSGHIADSRRCSNSSQEVFTY